VKKSIKNNYMKILACMVWVIGIPASIALGWQRVYGRGAMVADNFDVMRFSWTQAVGFAALFLVLGFIAFLLACIYHKRK